MDVLSKFFWVPFDQTKSWAVNFTKIRKMFKLPIDGVDYPDGFKFNLRPNASSNRIGVKSKVVKHIKSYQMDAIKLFSKILELK